MKIAVPFEKGFVFQHFGHTETFRIYECEDGKILTVRNVSTNGQGHSALSRFLSDNGAEILLCGGIGGGAKTALGEAGITIYPGVSGMADIAVMDFLAGRLRFDPDFTCNHHDHGEGHDCGEHGCGEHSCS